MRWLGISRLFEFGRGAEAEHKLAQAYRTLFDSSDLDVQIILADLADYTGFYRVNGPGVPPDERAFSDGMRAAYGRLFRFLNLTDAEKAALAEAARVESVASAAQGDF